MMFIQKSGAKLQKILMKYVFVSTDFGNLIFFSKKNIGNYLVSYVQMCNFVAENRNLVKRQKLENDS